jgi:hypothetical protein
LDIAATRFRPKLYNLNEHDRSSIRGDSNGGETMKLSLTGLGITFAIVWGGMIFVVGVANLVSETYGVAFLEVIASVYPGYSLDGDFGSVLVGTLYGALDGAIGGFVLAWVYNRFAGDSGS